MKKAVHAILAISLTVGLPSFARDVIIETPAGGINWTEGVVFANGYGTAKANLSSAQRRILSRRAAIVDAQRNLLEITKGVRIDSTADTNQTMQANKEIATRVQGIIKGAQVTRDHYQNEIATVTLAMPISGKFLRTLYPTDRPSDEQAGYRIRRFNFFNIEQQLNQISHSLLGFFVSDAKATNAFTVQNESEASAYKRLLHWVDDNGNTELDSLLYQALIQFESNARFSGLLIDASAIPSFELATIPKIRDETGTIIYPSETTSYDDIVNKRGVSYDFDLQDAIRNQRVATTPFVIKAISTYKSLPSDLIINKADADSIKQSLSIMDAMNRAGVLIVVAI